MARVRRLPVRLGLAALLLAASWSGAEARHHHRSAQSEDAAPGGFDFYLLSLSVAPSFCALTGAREGKQECAAPQDRAYRDTPLTVHGLWPNRAGVGVRGQPQNCDAAPLPALPASLRTDLAHYMPGSADGLDRYEWQKHGACSGLPPEAYFSAVVAAAREADATIGGAIRQHGWFGQQVAVRDLLDAVAQSNPALASAIVVDCKMARKTPAAAQAPVAYISEIRVLLAKDFPASASGDAWPASAFVPVSQVGYHANSGCPNGAGFLPSRYGASKLPE